MSAYTALKELAKNVLPAAAVSAIGRYRRRNFYRYQPRLTTRCFGGYDLTVELVDQLSESWYAHDWSLPPEIPLLQQSKLKPGAVVFDLGAHQCVVAMLLSKTVGPNGLVVALEGGSANARTGQRNVQLNSISNCTVIHGVASGKSGMARFDGFGNGSVIIEEGSTKAWRPEMVPAYSVDDLAAAHGCPDVVYVDVEGWECEVLDGAKQTFEARPDWFVEVHQGVGLERLGGSIERVLSHFDGAYQCFIAEQTPANDFAKWNDFEPLDRSKIPAERFYLVALAKPAMEGA